LAALLVVFWVLICVANLADNGHVFVWTTLLLVPVITVSAAVAFALRAGQRARAALSAAYSAFPPVRDGAPTRCRVCGVVLAWRHDQAIVACEFCRSENLVHPDVLASVSWERAATVQQFDHQLRSRIANGYRAAAKGTAVMIGAVVGTPIACILLVTAVLVVHRLAIGQRAADDSIEYLGVQVGNRWCVAELIEKRSGHFLIDHGTKPPKEYRGRRRRWLRSTERRGTFKATALRGRRVKLPDGREKDVTGVIYLGSERQNYLVLTGIEERPARGACFAAKLP